MSFAVLVLLLVFPVCELVVESIHYRRRARIRRQQLMRDLLKRGPDDYDIEENHSKPMLEMNTRRSSHQAAKEVVI